MADGKRGRPSTTIWTPEMREAMAGQRRGEANPMYGTVSPRRGDRLPISRQTRNYGRTIARLLHPPQPCEICGNPKAERHHVTGNTADNSVENIRFLCRKHHILVGHNGRWANLPPDVSDERAVGPATLKRSPMSPEREAAWRAELRERSHRLMTPERASAMAHKAHEANPMTSERASEMGKRPRPPWTPERRAKMEAMLSARKAQP
jgi:hypothetical protein